MTKERTIKQLSQVATILMLIGISSWFCACSSDDDMPAATDTSQPAAQEGKMPINVAMIETGSATRGTGTHMTTFGVNTVFADAQPVDLFLKESGDVESNTTFWYYDGATPYYLKSGNGDGQFSWYTTAERTISATNYWPATGNSLYFYAWYPRDAVTNINGSKFTFTVSTDQGALGGDASSDLMLGTPRSGNPVSRTSIPVPLAFNHLMAKVQVTLSNKLSTQAVATLVNSYTVSIGNNDIYLQADVSPTTGELITNTSGTTGTVTLKNAGVVVFSTTDPYAATQASHWCLIPPQTLTGKKITIGDTEYEIPQKDGANIIAQPGYIYTINLEVTSKENIRFNSITIQAWTEDEVTVNFTN